MTRKNKRLASTAFLFISRGFFFLFSLYYQSWTLTNVLSHRRASINLSDINFDATAPTPEAASNFSTPLTVAIAKRYLNLNTNSTRPTITTTSTPTTVNTHAYTYYTLNESHFRIRGHFGSRKTAIDTRLSADGFRQPLFVVAGDTGFRQPSSLSSAFGVATAFGPLHVKAGGEENTGGGGEQMDAN